MKEAALSQFIYKFLILNGRVSLPGIGSFEIVHLPAINDLSKHHIISPSSVAKFSNIDTPADFKMLLNYLIRHLNISENSAMELLKDFCLKIKTDVEAGSTVLWKGLGTFGMSSDGTLVFEIQLPDSSLNYSMGNAISTVVTNDNNLIIESETDSFSTESNTEHKKSFVDLKTATIILLTTALIFLIIRYAFGNFHFMDSRYEKVEATDSPATYKVNNN